MTKQTNADQKEDKELPIVDQCFIITPIGEVNSETYNKAMGLIDAVIEPVLVEFKMQPLAANQMSSPGSINNQLLKAILEDKLVIANLTGLNPNVMYELAVRHAARLPVVIMAERGTRLPFDITDQRTIFYDDSLAGLNTARQQLRLMVEKALSDKEPDNPIYHAAEQALIFKSLKEDDPLKLVMERLDQMETRIGSIARPLDKNSFGLRSSYSISGDFADGVSLSQKEQFAYLYEMAILFQGVQLVSVTDGKPMTLNFFVDNLSQFTKFIQRITSDINFVVKKLPIL